MQTTTTWEERGKRRLITALRDLGCAQSGQLAGLLGLDRAWVREQLEAFVAAGVIERSADLFGDPVYSIKQD